MDQYIGRFLDNRYEILELIGTGGMAVVYKARCHRLNRLVAIKILKDDFSREEEFRRRFHAEGEAVASLSHPNIVQAYDVSSSDNANFIVMELIDGITLKQYMAKKGTLNWKETLHFAMQIAKALEHAHGRGIVHRDIKPHNVMVLKNGSVKVTDFGIARVMSKSNTLTKEALGSVHYISPEQAKGGWVDNRSDLYSLSVVMYEMMTGRPPYDGESPVAVAIKHINGGAPEPSSLNPNIPAGLEQIIMKGMALDVKDRYISATEMLQDMDQFRMNPAIRFAAPQPVSADATIVLKPEQVAEAVRQSRPATERVPSQTGSVPRTRTTQQSGRIVSQNTGRQSGQQRTHTASNQNAKAAAAAGAARRTEESRSNMPHRKTREEIRREVREEERNRAATIAVVACSAVAIIAILIFLVVLVNGGLVGRGENLVYVPDLEGKYVEQTTNSVTGLVIEIDKYVNSNEHEKGKIISHTPEYGAQVLQGTVVKVTVSLGPEPEVKTMSYMVGYQEADARAVLSGLGMVPVAMEEFSEIVEKGKVSRTDPAFGEVLTEGQTVYIYISKGPLIETAEMPYVIGLDYATAKKMLEGLGFDNVDFVRKDGKQDKDEVIEQPYAKGEKVDITSEIVLSISKGNGKETPKPAEKPKQEQTSNSQSNQNNQNDVNDYTPAPPQSSTQNTSQGSSGSSTTNKNVTKSVSISLPSDRSDQYLLGIYQNNMQVVEDTVITPGTMKHSVTLTGSGVQSYDLYINNQFYKTVKVDFNAND